MEEQVQEGPWCQGIKKREECGRCRHYNPGPMTMKHWTIVPRQMKDARCPKYKGK